MPERDPMDRYEDMVSYIQEKGKVTVNGLSNQFKVSPCTIRRVLTKMSQDNLVERFHGGAVFIKSNNSELPVSRRAAINYNEKSLIGKAAAELIGDGETVILLGGTSVNLICPHLKNKKNIKVITNSILIVNELMNNDNIEVIFLGGVVNRKELFVTGYLTSLCINELHADKLFMGIRAIHPVHGLMLEDVNELGIYRSFVKAAEVKIVAADYSKFSQTGTVALAPISQADIIVTDDKAPMDFIDELKRNGTEVVIAKENN